MVECFKEFREYMQYYHQEVCADFIYILSKQPLNDIKTKISSRKSPSSTVHNYSNGNIPSTCSLDLCLS